MTSKCGCLSNNGEFLQKRAACASQGLAVSRAVYLQPHRTLLCNDETVLYRSAVDKIVIGMMRPLYDKGIRPHNMSDLLLELHSKKYHHRYIRRERLLAKGVAPGSLDTFLGPSLGARTSMYSTFADKTKYAGLVPTGEWMRAHPSSDRDPQRRAQNHPPALPPLFCPSSPACMFMCTCLHVCFLCVCVYVCMFSPSA